LENKSQARRYGPTVLNYFDIATDRPTTSGSWTGSSHGARPPRLSEQVTNQWPATIQTMLLAGFSVLALLLGSVRDLRVLSYASERRREIGIRARWADGRETFCDWVWGMHFRWLRVDY